MLKIIEVELTPAQKRAWIDTRSALLWTCPAFTSILFSMLNPAKGELAALFTKDIPVAATDGEHLILNPEVFFTKYTLPERVFIVAHEIMHAIYNHCSISRTFMLSGKVSYQDGTVLDYSGELMNVAMDLVINDALLDSRVGTMPKDACHDKTIATSKDTFMESYKKVYKKAQQFAGKGFDQLLNPGAGSGKDPGQAAQGRSQAEWDTAVAGAVASAKLQGLLPGALERLLSEVLEPTVEWQDLIRAFFARKVGVGSYDFRKPDRRLISRDDPIYAPRRSGNGCGEVVVAIDTSGSIGQKELNVFFGELKGILSDVQPEKVYVIWCDAKVHKVDEVEDPDDIDGLKPHGGGGTAFEPPFKWVEDNDVRPEALVYLTDGYGSFPASAPNYPVIWGDISKRGAKSYPWGEVVEIEIK